MKEYGGSPARKQCRSRIRLGNRRRAQGLQVGCDFVDLSDQLTLGRELTGGSNLERFDAQQIHAVVGSSLRLDYETSNRRRLHEIGSFAGGEIGTVSALLHYDQGCVHAGIP